MPHAFLPSISASTLLLLALMDTPAWALYKVVGPDGKVTYTDRPPTDQASQSIKSNGVISASGSLPFELRQISAKFPVTLYAAKACAPCDQGRNLLRQRGVPFTEKKVDTAAAAAALERLEGTQQVPVLRVGQQQIQGYSSTEWQAYLDAAGYPKQSTLPPGYLWPDASSLAPQAAPAAASRPASPRPPERTRQSPPSGTSPETPGFRF